MPVIQREKIMFEGETFVRVFKVGADGAFSVALPAPVADMLGFEIVRGANKLEVERAFDAKVKEYVERQSTSKKVILYSVKSDIAFAHGFTLDVWAREYIETKIVGAGRDFFKYEVVPWDEHALDSNLWPRNEWDVTPAGREEADSKIDWTPERVEFFNKIALALERIKDELLKLEDPGAAARIADNGRFLENKKERAPDSGEN